MSAHDKYIRLEALGIWRERPGAAPREVVVSLGSSTLLLTDLDDRPLGHWALAGAAELGRDRDGIVYSMTADGAETLTIRDPEMAAAIAAVARRPRGPVAAPRPPRRRPPVAALLLAALVALGLAAPRLVAGAAARVVPPGQAVEFGDRMLIALVERRGPPCAGPEGERALGRLAARLDRADPARLRVMALGGAPVAALPGGILVLDRASLAAAGDPDAVAGWVALALGRDPVAGLMRGAGTLAGLRYLVGGDLGDAALARAAEAAVSAPTAAETAPALTRLEAAGLDPRPFLAALGAAGPAPGPGAAAPAPTPALGAADWAALRGICG